MMKLETFCGGKIYLDINESPVMQGFKSCSWQYKQRQLMGQMASNIHTFIDIGACLGYFTLFMAKKMEDQGQIFSFEPHHENYRWLNKSISANHYQSIKTFQIALSNKDETTNLYLSQEQGEHTLIPNQENKTTRIKCNKLDTILKKKHIKHVDLVKIDVEGAEQLVLQGMQKTIKNNPHIKIIIDLHPDKTDSSETIQFLYNHDFNIYAIDHDLKPAYSILNPNTIGEILATKISKSF